MVCRCPTAAVSHVFGRLIVAGGGVFSDVQEVGSRRSIAISASVVLVAVSLTVLSMTYLYLLLHLHELLEIFFVLVLVKRKLNGAIVLACGILAPLG